MFRRQHRGSGAHRKHEKSWSTRPVQLSNVPEVRPARRLLFLACVLFAGLFVLNVVSTAIAFANDDSDRWINLARLAPNLVVPYLIWRGYVLLAALAERASLYQHVIEKDLPRLRAAVEERVPLHRTPSRPATPAPQDPPATQA